MNVPVYVERWVNGQLVPLVVLDYYWPAWFGCFCLLVDKP